MALGIELHPLPMVALAKVPQVAADSTAWPAQLVTFAQMPPSSSSSLASVRRT